MGGFVGRVDFVGVGEATVGGDEVVGLGDAVLVEEGLGVVDVGRGVATGWGCAVVGTAVGAEVCCAADVLGTGTSNDVFTGLGGASLVPESLESDTPTIAKAITTIAATPAPRNIAT